MTDGEKTRILALIEKFKPLDNTNLWDGLKTGMDLLKKSTAPSKSFFSSFKSAPAKEKAPGRFSTIFILTDGMPNVTPPRGHVPMLKSYLDALDDSHKFNINTFGFGYSLDSPLLLDIAKLGGGGYSFIPDSGIVGTVFVNAVANAYATYAPHVRLDVEIPSDTIVEVKGGYTSTKTSWGVQINAGDLQFGQSLDFVLQLKDIPKSINATLTYRPSNAVEDLKVHGSLSGKAIPDLAPIQYHAARLDFVTILWTIKQKELDKSVKLLESLSKSITTSPILANHADALALEQDISGEGILALESTNYNRWGRHYLPSLARSHQRQQCGNFKDPGLQVYGSLSKVFIEERDKLDAAFMELPPPKPSILIYTPGTGYKPAAQLKSMSKYYSSCGPCFAGDCLVALPGNRSVRVDELKRGMDVQTLTGTSKVAAVLRTRISSGESLLCHIGGLKITPWHPIVSKDTNSWVFPANVTTPSPTACDAVYSLLLLPTSETNAENGDPNAHSVSIAGVWCVTLGHGLTTTGDSDVRSHCFLGNYRKVLKELSKLDGFFDNDGVVECVGTRRDSSDGTICGFVRKDARVKRTLIGLGARGELYV